MRRISPTPSSYIVVSTREVDWVRHGGKQLQRRDPFHSVHQRSVPFHSRNHPNSVVLEESGFMGGRGDCIIVSVCSHTTIHSVVPIAHNNPTHNGHYSVHNAKIKSDCLFLRQWGFLRKTSNACRGHGQLLLCPGPSDETTALTIDAQLASCVQVVPLSRSLCWS